MRINKSKLISAIFSPLYLLIDRKINKKNKNKKNKKILLIFLGYIGDYILFRNFISEIKKDPKYKNYKITFCGDPLWKGISENLDKKYIDSFIWINRKNFLIKPFYRFNILKKINKKFFEIAIMPNYGRSFPVDSIFKISNSINKIGNNGSSESIFSWQKKISDRYYTKLIFLKNGNEFEFLKNKDFFEQFLNKKLHTNFSIPIKKININEKYAVFVPGAGAKFRRWSAKNFAEIADFIIQKKKFKIKILGSKKDSEIAKEIINNSNYPEKIKNLTGDTLLKSINIIGNSNLLISNDTGAAHIAAATNTLTLCISNGNSFGKFHPYPKEISKKMNYIYPSLIKNKSFKELVKKYSRGSNLDINIITPKEVIAKLDTLLN